MRKSFAKSKPQFSYALSDGTSASELSGVMSFGDTGAVRLVSSFSFLDVAFCIFELLISVSVLLIGICGNSKRRRRV